MTPLPTIDTLDELVALHRRAGNVVTIATHERTNVIDYGVLHTEPGESPRLVAYDEKPNSTLTVSMGIYVIEPEALDELAELISSELDQQ